MRKLNVGVFNDSFPPILDGVANATVNYARSIQKIYGKAVVATPWYPKVKDDYPFRVIRYSSTNVSKRLGYRMGNPFNPLLIKKLENENLDIIHIHSPFTSALLARVLRRYTGAPIVFTYHTKFDVDIEKRVAFNPLRKVSIKFLMSNINACDEVWVVSEGAGENLIQLGYEGEFQVMENGTDFEKGLGSEESMQTIRQQYGIEVDDTVFLFVGRMMWYKNLKFTIDSLKAAKEQGATFKMLFVGDGVDRPSIQEYIAALGLEKDCIFTGAIHDREHLRSYFSIANLFLFPSTYDTNGIVVREAAACGCPSLLIDGSCASEKIQHNITGILIDETIDSMSSEILLACGENIGKNATDQIYLSWDDAVGKAFKRYHHIIEQKSQVKLNA